MGSEFVGSKSEHVLVYQRVLQVFGKSRFHDSVRENPGTPGDNLPYANGRDPRLLGRVIAAFVESVEWSDALAKADLLVSWSLIVGESTAAHTYAVSADEGTLVVRCDSTAWAQNLRMMQNTYLGAIAENYPDAHIAKIRFLGPDVPSWKRGSRAIPGRGPRDTYG